MFDIDAPLQSSPSVSPQPDEIDDLDAAAARAVALLELKYQTLIRVDPKLTRKAVSFQANKIVPVLRWYKYKEGFSGGLVARYLTELAFPDAPILDPFAGAGTTLATASELGFSCHGIELLPIGQLIIQARLELASANTGAIASKIRSWLSLNPWKSARPKGRIPTLRITAGAYSSETERDIAGYLEALRKEEGPTHTLLLLGLLSVLEAVSFTRKDGQYLRWDHRCNRTGLKSRFDKGSIPTFSDAITAKLLEMADDVDRYQSGRDQGDKEVRLHAGSCLDILPTFPAASFGGVITSPPYCNRYDYTRTYALEHALLGVTEQGTKDLRQAMLTCTVENREKSLEQSHPQWAPAIRRCHEVQALQAILAALERQAGKGLLNNPHIPRMVRGYFVEMACVIFELSRILIPGGKVVMVNDNVRYGGLDVPVDCILSEIAAAFGLTTVELSALPRGKGNSSQQMGAHGRREMRKSVYIWEKQ